MLEPLLKELAQQGLGFLIAVIVGLISGVVVVTLYKRNCQLQDQRVIDLKVMMDKFYQVTTKVDGTLSTLVELIKQS